MNARVLASYISLLLASNVDNKHSRSVVQFSHGNFRANSSRLTQLVSRELAIDAQYATIFSMLTAPLACEKL